MLVSDTSYFHIIFGYNELFLKTSPELHKLVIGFENKYALRADHFACGANWINKPREGVSFGSMGACWKHAWCIMGARENCINNNII